MIMTSPASGAVDSLAARRLLRIFLNVSHIEQMFVYGNFMGQGSRYDSIRTVKGKCYGTGKEE